MIKIGVLSLDHPHAGGNHLPALKYMKDRVCVHAIYHESYDEAKEWLDCFSAKHYQTRDDLLADPEIQAVLITSKNNRHAEDVIAAANAGKDILCDKPIAVSLEESKAMAEAVKANNVRFFVTYPVRFNESVLKAKELADSGALGEIKAIMATNHGCMYEPGVPDWVLRKAENGGGSLIDHTVHVADIIRWITKQEFTDVKAEAENALRNYIDAEDITVLHGRMSGGTIYQIDASWSRRKNDPVWGDVTMRIVGTKGSVFLDIYNNQYIEAFIDGEVKNYYPNLIVYEHGCIFEDYRKVIEENQPPIGADIIDGVRTIELVCAAYKSLSDNGFTVVENCV